MTWYSGPVFTDDNSNAIGSLRLIEFPDRSAARAYIDADPYTKAGIFQSISVERWQPGLDVRQRDYVHKDGTMQFVIHAHDRPSGGARRRAPLRDAHIGYLEKHRDILVAHGPLLADGSETIGAVFIVDVANKAQAEAFWVDEPFNRAGIYDSTIERWRFGHV